MKNSAQEDMFIEMIKLQAASSFPEFEFNRYPIIYHYTSALGLTGILQTDCPVLWFTRIDCLNDTDEGNDIKKQYKSICDSLKNESVIDEKIYKMISNLEPADEEAIVYDYQDIDPSPLSNENDLYSKPPFAKIGSFKTEVYVCCFSTSDDLLPMWNYYSQGSAYHGYNVGFQSEMFDTSVRNIQNRKQEKIDGCKIKVIKVIYDDQEKLDLLKKRLTIILSSIKNQSLDTIHIRKIIVDMLSKLRFSFKNVAFKHEEEIRVVLYRPLPQDKTSFDMSKLPIIDYKEKKGLIIPYSELRMDKCKKKVLQVTVGPLIERGTAARLVSNFLKDNKYFNCKVKESSVPIRN